jgi:hypothetical protein
MEKKHVNVFTNTGYMKYGKYKDIHINEVDWSYLKYMLVNFELNSYEIDMIWEAVEYQFINFLKINNSLINFSQKD